MDFAPLGMLPDIENFARNRGDLINSIISKAEEATRSSAMRPPNEAFVRAQARMVADVA